jgi:hypothetical protein
VMEVPLRNVYLHRNFYMKGKTRTILVTDAAGPLHFSETGFLESFVN